MKRKREFASTWLAGSLFGAFALGACTKAPRARPPVVVAAPPVLEDAGVDAAALLAPTEQKTLRPEIAGDPTYLGMLDRKGLIVIIDQGLGRVLQRLKLSPSMVGARFEGFRVSEIDPAWSASGLSVGDVLLRLNGQPIERPEQAQLAFDSLRVASELALELKRAGTKMTLRYRVE